MTKELSDIAKIGKLAYQINAMAISGATNTKVSVELTKRNTVLMFIDGDEVDDADKIVSTKDLDKVVETLESIREASKYKNNQFFRAHETKVSIALANVRDELKNKYGIELNQISWNKIFKECIENWEAVEDGTEDK